MVLYKSCQYQINPHHFCIPLCVLIRPQCYRTVLNLFPLWIAANSWKHEMTVDLPCLSPSFCLRHSLCPLGVPFTEALGSVDQGSLPASQSVCTLGRDGPAPPLVLALKLHLSQWFPHRCAAVLCPRAQRESSHNHTHTGRKDIYVVKHCIRKHSLYCLACDGHIHFFINDP